MDAKDVSARKPTDERRPQGLDDAVPARSSTGTPARKIPSTPKLIAKEVAKEASQMLGPDAWASDLTWDLFGFWACIHHLASPIRSRIQTLARKHRERPEVFAREFRRVQGQFLRAHQDDPAWRHVIATWLAYREKVKHLLTKPASDTPPFAFPLDASQRQVKAVSESIPLTRTMLGLGLKKKDRLQVKRLVANPKKLLDILGALTAKRPGPQPQRMSRTIRKIYREGRARGVHLTYGQIAARAYPQYKSENGAWRIVARRFVQEALRNYRQKS